MNTDVIPTELSGFLARHVDSIAQLEALLLLRGSPDVVWDVPATAQRLYISNQEATETLAHLCEHGLLMRQDVGYRFSPTSGDLRNLVDLLAQHYARHLIPVTNLIHAKPRRIRQFADAFKLKKD